MWRYPVGEGANRTRTSDMAGELPAAWEAVKLCGFLPLLTRRTCESP